MDIRIAPSILSADFGKLNEEIAAVEPFVDLLHVDIMDGHFVPNITFGPPVVRCIRTKLPLDLHLMIAEPEKYVEPFAKALEDAGQNLADCSMTIHAESTQHLHRVIQQVRDAGTKVAVSVNPATPLEAIEEVLDDVDMVLIMSVNPGFGGQSFIPHSLDKIKELRAMKPELDIEVDGGVKEETGKQCKEAGANILVAGSYIFGAEDRAAAIQSLR